MLDSVWTKPDSFKVLLKEEEEAEGGDSGLSEEEMETDEEAEEGSGSD